VLGRLLQSRDERPLSMRDAFSADETAEARSVGAAIAGAIE